MKLVVFITFALITVIAALLFSLEKLATYGQVKSIDALPLPGAPQSKSDVTKLNDGLGFAQQRIQEQEMDLSTVHGELYSLNVDVAKLGVKIDEMSITQQELKDHQREDETRIGEMMWAVILLLAGIIAERVWVHSNARIRGLRPEP